MDYDERRDQLRELSSLDESADYEVDMTSICVDDDGNIILLTASGCSCWCGEYEEEQFASLDDLERSLIGDDRTYNPSLVGVKTLLEEARNRL